MKDLEWVRFHSFYFLIGDAPIVSACCRDSTQRVAGRETPRVHSFQSRDDDAPSSSQARKVAVVPFRPHADPDRLPVADGLRDEVDRPGHAAQQRRAGREGGEGFGVSTILTTVAEKSFSGPMFDEITRCFPSEELIDRTSMNTWEDARITERVNAIGKTRIVLAGLWTSVCIVGPALSALDQGFEVYVIADACGDVSDEAHERAMERMIQAGARPMTSLQYLLELQRDWARGETYNQTVATAIEHGGGYGLGLIYAKTMFGGSEGH